VFARRSTVTKQINVCKRGREPKIEALHKPGVCEAKHTDKTNKRVQKGKGTRIEALHKPGVCEAKYAQHKLDSQLAQAKT